MNDDIKEILNGFKEILDNPTTTDECYNGRIIEINRSYDLDLEEIKTLLDYITNLQEERDKYKMRCYKANKMIWDNYGVLDKYEIETLEDILEGKEDEQ